VAPLRVICSWTGKRCYGTAGVAQTAAVHAHLRIYRCPFCGAFHLTSKPWARPEDR